MNATSSRRVQHADYISKHNQHRVSLVESNDKPRIASNELEDFTWWD